jgi:S-DNA-T family DNA segregation ATPase FtsK/SpoIIIE
VALALVAMAVAGLVVGYTGLFGTIGIGTFDASRSLLGRAAWLGWIALGASGLRVLARAERPRRRAHIGLVLLVVACSALVAEASAPVDPTRPDGGGLLGGLLARGLLALEGRPGAIVTTVALIGTGLALAAEVRWAELAEAVADRLRARPDVGTGSASTPREARGGGRLGVRSSGEAGPASAMPAVIEPSFAELDGPELAEAAAGHDREVPSADATREEQRIPRVEDVRAVDTALPGGVAGEPSTPHPSVWELPRRSLLRRGSRAKLDRGELIRSGQVLQQALASHGVAVSVVGMTTGPTVTRYELELGEGVKVARVLALQRDIAYAMASPDVRILAPIPGRSAIGIEVPNRVREVVTLGDVLGDVRGSAPILAVPLGRDIAGRSEIVDLARMPHLLIAGTTGSGKSSLVNSILVSLLMRQTPDDLRLILIDPKRVELSQYAGLPHLLTQVVVDPKRAAAALSWAVAEMERRYDVLAHWAVRDVDGYRELVRMVGEDADVPEEGRPEVLPTILVVIDELNDLMMAAPRDVEDAICRIAQKARAVGIHLVVATQRPSVDVITGVIKTNIPARIAFAVASQTDSRVILDQPGAEKLVGKGDLLFVTAESSQPRRLQAPWVSEAEIAQVVGAWRRQGRPRLVAELEQGVPGSRESTQVDDDPLFQEAVRLVVESQMGSTSMLQRRLKVGFARAGRLMDLLEERGIVGPAEGSKARQVLVRPDELAALWGPPDQEPSQGSPRPLG